LSVEGPPSLRMLALRGCATTILLAAYGAEVVIAEVDQAKADEAVTEIDQAFGAPQAQIDL
jgi:hypothetical protein